TSIQLSCANNVTIDVTLPSVDISGAPNLLPACTYPSPGVYTALINVINAPSGQTAQTVYTGTLTVVVQDPVALDALLRSLWSGMNDALKAGDQSRAATYLDDTAAAAYAPVFAALAPSLPSIVGSYSDLSHGHIGRSFAEY